MTGRRTQIRTNSTRKATFPTKNWKTQYELTNAHIENIEFKNMLSDEGESSAPYSNYSRRRRYRNCDWASMLMRMYMMWAEKQGYK